MDNKFNAEFFDHYTQGLEKVDESNEYKAMGYASDGSAGARHDRILDRLSKYAYNKQGISVLDVGAGTGAMWEGAAPLSFKVSNLVLLEPYEKYHDLLRQRVKKFKGIDCDIVPDNLDNYFQNLKYSAVRYDVVISCGALNYYDSEGARKFIKQMAELTRFNGLIIVESNIMTPNTPWSPGNFNPSFETMHSAFNSICDEFDVKVFRNYTTIWSGFVKK